MEKLSNSAIDAIVVAIDDQFHKLQAVELEVVGVNVTPELKTVFEFLGYNLTENFGHKFFITKKI